MRRREFGARRLDGRSRPCGRNENGMEQEPGARRIFRDRGSMVPASDLHGPRPTTPTSSANAEAAEEKHLRSPGCNVQKVGNCELRRAWRGSGVIKASGMKPATFLLPSMAGSLKASIRAI